ncbi:hypothetical protein GJ496_001530 [Pomphorhynchus laevis]|nr:hypothetical protein GJ496_001530 [Pomphorhynchus laevis]
MSANSLKSGKYERLQKTQTTALPLRTGQLDRHNCRPPQRVGFNKHSFKLIYTNLPQCILSDVLRIIERELEDPRRILENSFTNIYSALNNLYGKKWDMYVEDHIYVIQPSVIFYFLIGTVGKLCLTLRMQKF